MRKGLQHGYINRHGDIVIDPIYDQANEFRDGIAIVKRNGTYGLIDSMGKQLIPTQLKLIDWWENRAYRLETSDKKLGLMDGKGQLILDTIYDEITLVKEKYIRAKEKGKTGHFDLAGEVMIPLVYDALGFVSDEGFIAAQKEGKWGFINTQGEVVLPFDYEDSRMGFREGRTWVKKDGNHVLMDPDFNILKEFQYEHAGYFNRGSAIIGKTINDHPYGPVYGFINKDGVEFIPPQYHTAFVFNKYGISTVGIRDQGITRRFLIDLEGNRLASDRTYFGLSYFGSELIHTDGPKMTFISAKTGEEIPEFPYTALYPMRYSDRTDLATVHQESKKGVIDTSLTELLAPVFDDIGVYIRHRLGIRQDGLWGFADQNFRIRIPTMYHQIGSFRYHVAEVEKNDLKGVIHPNGRVLVPLRYTDLTIDYISHRIIAKKEDGYDLYDMEGRLLLETDFSSFSGFWNANHATFRKDGKMGAIGFDLQILCEPIYDRIGPFYDGMAWVINGQKGGFINSKFEVVVPVELDGLEAFAFGFTKVKKGAKEFYIDTNGQEIFPDEVRIKEREAEIQRREDRFFHFSS